MDNEEENIKRNLRTDEDLRDLEEKILNFDERLEELKELSHTISEQGTEFEETLNYHTETQEELQEQNKEMLEEQRYKHDQALGELENEKNNFANLYHDKDKEFNKLAEDYEKATSELSIKRLAETYHTLANKTSSKTEIIWIVATSLLALTVLLALHFGIKESTLGIVLRMSVSIPFIFIDYLFLRLIHRKNFLKDSYQHKSNILNTYYNMMYLIDNDDKTNHNISQNDKNEMTRNVFNIILESEADKLNKVNNEYKFLSKILKKIDINKCIDSFMKNNNIIKNDKLAENTSDIQETEIK